MRSWSILFFGEEERLNLFFLDMMLSLGNGYGMMRVFLDGYGEVGSFFKLLDVFEVMRLLNMWLNELLIRF